MDHFINRDGKMPHRLKQRDRSKPPQKTEFSSTFNKLKPISRIDQKNSHLNF